MRARIPTLIVCTLFLAAGGCGQGQAGDASSEASASGSSQGTSQAASQAKKGPPLYDVSKQKCEDWKGKKRPADATSSKTIEFNGGKIRVTPAGPALGRQGDEIVFTSKLPFAVKIPDSVDVTPHHVSAKPASPGADASARFQVASDALCGEFEYSVAVVVDGVPYVKDPPGMIWP